MFENMVLPRSFGPKTAGVTGGWRKLHNEELHDLYSSPSIIRIIKSRRMRWAGHVARMGEKMNVKKYTLARNAFYVKYIPVAGRGVLWSCEMYRVLQFLYNLLTDGREVVSFSYRPRSTTMNLFLFLSLSLSLSGF
jgi:hypothetical protein